MTQHQIPFPNVAALGSLVEQNELSEDVIWSSPGGPVWKARHFAGTPNFYPVYSWHDYYSYSPFMLMVAKGRLQPTVENFECAHDSGWEVKPPQFSMDREIRRIGGPPRFTRGIGSADQLVRDLADAMVADVARAETNNPGAVNYILCGGKDSLNLLLLPWKNPVKVLSAEPNYPLVCDFIEKNGLGFEAIHLQDDTSNINRDREAAEASCMVDLQHWRWSGHLYDIAQASPQPVIFWKGQQADLYLTPFWRRYTARTNANYQRMRKIYNKAAGMMPVLFDGLFAANALTDVERSVWLRSAVLQGAHMGFLRSLTGALCLSAYHGPQTWRVLCDIDLPKVSCRGDHRPAVGRLLKGRDVIYPDQNPGPGPSTLRAGWNHPDVFIDAVRKQGILVDLPAR